jgi:thiamine-phosphate pyrophosphorylase
MCFSRSRHSAAGLPPLPPAPDSAPIVCYVTDRKGLGSVAPMQGLLDKIESVVAAGADWIQIREKDLLGRDLFNLARGAVRAGAARIIINDRLDVALAAHAGGVHLGHESAPAREVVRWCRAGNAPAGFLIGVSCHSREEVKEAETAGADYVFFGPVFETPSKASFGAPQGIARLGEACVGVRVPVIAIGGIGEENGEECIRAGAAGIAAIRMFQEAADFKTLKGVIERIHGLA